MRVKRYITIGLAATAIVASAVPALAGAEDRPRGLERAMEVAAQAVAYSATGDAAPAVDPTAPPTTVSDPGPGKADPPAHGKSDPPAHGKSDPPGQNKSDRPGRGEADPPGKPEFTGKDRAMQAISEALLRGNGNPAGRTHAQEVLGMLQASQVPATLQIEDNHGAQVVAMVHAFNALRAAERAGD